MMDTEGSFRMALDALASVDVVGITENMDASMTTLGKLLDFKPTAKAPHVNVTRRFDRRNTMAGEGSSDRLSPLILGELARLTRIDNLIYEAACGQLHNAKTRAGGELSRSRGTT